MAVNSNDPLYGYFFISDFSSLNFDDSWKQPYQAPKEYVQKFVVGDNIKLQFARKKDSNVTVTLYLTNLKTSVESIVSYTDIDTSTDWIISEATFQSGQAAEYSLKVVASAPDIGEYTGVSRFCVLSDNEGLILLTYTNRRNAFNTVFTEGSFDFRCEGSLLPSGAEFNADTEGFRDQNGSFTQLYSLPYRVDTLSIGGGFGVPNWVGEKINNIFSLTSVKLDGEEYVRSEQSIPEITTLGNDHPLYVYNLKIEKKKIAG